MPVDTVEKQNKQEQIESAFWFDLEGHEYVRLETLVRTWLRKYGLSDQFDPRDIVHEAVLKAALHLKRHGKTAQDKERYQLAWLISIAINIVRDLWRSQRKDAVRIVPFDVHDTGDNADDRGASIFISRLLPDGFQTQESLLEEEWRLAEMRATLNQALQWLSAKNPYRYGIVQRHLAGATFKDIAEEKNISEGQAKNEYRLAVKQLRYRVQPPAELQMK